jgi:hypothetical protein
MPDRSSRPVPFLVRAPATAVPLTAGTVPDDMDVVAGAWAMIGEMVELRFLESPMISWVVVAPPPVPLESIRMVLLLPALFSEEKVWLWLNTRFAAARFLVSVSSRPEAPAKALAAARFRVPESTVIWPV